MKFDTSVSLDPETFAELRRMKVYDQCTTFAKERCTDIVRNIMRFQMFGVLDGGFTMRSFFDRDGSYDVSDLSITWGTYWVVNEETGDCVFNEDYRDATTYLGEIVMYDTTGMSYDREVALQVTIPAAWVDPALSVYELTVLMRAAADAYLPKIRETLVRIEERRLCDAVSAMEDHQRRAATKAAEAAALRVSLNHLSSGFSLNDFLETRPKGVI